MSDQQPEPDLLITIAALVRKGQFARAVRGAERRSKVGTNEERYEALNVGGRLCLERNRFARAEALLLAAAAMSDTIDLAPWFRVFAHLHAFEASVALGRVKVATASLSRAVEVAISTADIGAVEDCLYYVREAKLENGVDVVFRALRLIEIRKTTGWARSNQSAPSV